MLIAALVLVLSVSPAVAGPDENPDLAGVYLHLPLALSGATGPLTTVFYISNTTSNSLTVNVKCWNDLVQRVGAAAGTNVSLGAFDIDVKTPSSLGLTSDPHFTGFGHCYFTSNSSSGDFAVAIAIGVQGSAAGSGGVEALFSSNASLMIGTSTAQANVSDDDANVPMWLGSNWLTVLFLIDPTPTNFGDANVDIYNVGGALQTSLSLNLQSRDMETFMLTGAAAHGNADVGRSSGTARGYVGWVYALNKTSFEAFLYDLPLDNDDVSPLTSADRP
jgi:hypothetical protein